MKLLTALLSAVVLAPTLSSAAIVVTAYPGSDNLPLTVLGATLVNTPDLDPGYARIDNISHADFGGSSALEFSRYFDENGDCLYWFRASSVLTTFVDQWSGVHWLGFGDDTLVDGATWGADNYIVLRDDDLAVAILQFSFNETSKRPTLIASAYDAEGLSFADGVAAIQGATVPEPSTSAFIIGAGTVGLLRRRRHSV